MYLINLLFNYILNIFITVWNSLSSWGFYVNCFYGFIKFVVSVCVFISVSVSEFVVYNNFIFSITEVSDNSFSLCFFNMLISFIILQMLIFCFYFFVVILYSFINILYTYLFVGFVVSGTSKILVINLSWFSFNTFLIAWLSLFIIFLLAISFFVIISLYIVLFVYIFYCNFSSLVYIIFNY